MEATWRQFVCPTCPSKLAQCPVKRWHAQTRDSKPFSTCEGCNVTYPAVPIGEEVGVGVCYFSCECGHIYNVVCTMQDKAECYDCNKMVAPYQKARLRPIKSKTDKKHSCVQCQGKGGICPYIAVLYQNNNHTCVTTNSL